MMETNDLDHRLDEMAGTLSSYLGIAVSSFRPLVHISTDWAFVISAASFLSLVLREFVRKELTTLQYGGLGGFTNHPAKNVINEYVSSLEARKLLDTEKRLGLILPLDREYLGQLYELRNKYAHEYRFFRAPIYDLIVEIWPGESKNRMRKLCYMTDETSLPKTSEELSLHVKAGFITCVSSMSNYAKFWVETMEGGLLGWAKSQPPSSGDEPSSVDY
jgi:hypothetical protein